MVIPVANKIFCIDVNQMAEFSMIGGTYETLEFYFYDSEGNPLDLESSTMKWRLCRLGQPDITLLEIEGEIFSGNGAVVEIQSQDTQNLYGKFIHQPVLIDYAGNEYVYQQGVITIIPKIQPIT